MIIPRSLGGVDMDERLTIKIMESLTSKKTISIYMSRGENLLEVLVGNNLSISSDCGALGTCGKCLVQVVEGALDITLQDKAELSETDIANGYRLACMAYPSMDCTIILATEINDIFNVVTESICGHAEINSRTDRGSRTYSGDSREEAQIGNTLDKGNDYIIAVDLGTTTLALALVALPEGEVVDNYTAINPQRVYGSDVVSRIKASNEGKLNILSRLVWEELKKGILNLIKKQQIKLEDIKGITISGNTTMIHILMEYPCDGLGTYPFTPVNIGLISRSADDIFAIDYKLPVTILPGISVFVGADITAGLLACGIDREESPCLFIDLGTNGEMALGNRDSILVTSTAAGPAFEGGNISCGIASIPGAICHVSCEGEQLIYETINDEPAIGICGTGLIELTAQLLKEGIIDSTGLLSDPYFENGYRIAGLRFIQKDIRELQMAKAAIRSGVDILVKRFGISYNQIDKVYIAGGFGYYLDIGKAIDIGLLPTALMNNARSVGNTSLSGAIYTIIDADADNRINHIISTAEEIHLANDEEFNDLFVQYLSF